MTPPDTSDDYRRTRRKKAHEALDRILDLEQQISLLSENREAFKEEFFNPAILAGVLGDFKFLATASSQMVEVLLEGMIHLYPTEPELPNKDLADKTVWRHFVAQLTLYGVPLPYSMASGMVCGLQALDEGEVQNVFTPSKTQKRDPAWTLARLKLGSFMHTYRLAGRGYTVDAAREIVAAKYGCTPDTLRTWATRDLKCVFGETFLERTKESCKKIGGFKNTSPPIAMGDDMKTWLEFLWFHSFGFDSGKLEELGKLYKKAINGNEVSLPWFLTSIGQYKKHPSVINSALLIHAGVT